MKDELISQPYLLNFGGISGLIIIIEEACLAVKVFLEVHKEVGGGGDPASQPSQSLTTLTRDRVRTLR